MKCKQSGCSSEAVRNGLFCSAHNLVHSFGTRKSSYDKINDKKMREFSEEQVESNNDENTK